MSTMAVIQKRSSRLACPYFMPTRRSDEAAWLHPVRLPLGAAWEGTCCAPGHHGTIVSSDDLRECNLGYASRCTRLPLARSSDAVRFGIACENGLLLSLRVICEKNYRPAGDTVLQYDSQQAQWISSHPDPQIQKMAECYLESYLSRKTQSVVDSTSSTDE
jgi:hypothetical protein